MEVREPELNIWWMWTIEVESDESDSDSDTDTEDVEDDGITSFYIEV